ncbi:uncharacterized protein LOC129958654 [Argiope bruennichi]|uniref:SAGA-associated factor 11 n=1 Tax=Argiope bruennichi TaxID=94029 RepID=A0A8T0F2Q5_ARGBR|nr:uncharacterized protein LOC129958654 [Argiope bruennichi]XP_055927238.1 uncharacterized protein LOC129958654 [Argiope bruennichi]XP_055927239.1 uncharacterized protein LOC129958654 [Argiope bruennichi]XP_055927240.1 uncharacterized protein LOC129958654 [Argiope bruennichi]XP_055927241.1 uncharacterized protein LOC129958654 [Argiope bruennichi]XP_055927242.1 uncharacterized protein LOC129958654 [Argiope bruennichi]XP_055927243.1 uncharacterized protein LOC129958654 [Argiope bruennichi]XP_0
MSVCEEISQNLKNQNALILEKSAVQNNKQNSGPQIEAFILNKGHQVIRKSIIYSREKRFGLSNSYFEFYLKSNDFSNDSHLETTRNSANFYKEIYSSCKEERKQSMSLEIIKNQSEFLEENLQNGIENKAVNAYAESDDLVPNENQESIQLRKSIEEKIAPEKNEHEDVASMSEESIGTKKILFKTGTEVCLKNPYLEFILKSEVSNHPLCVTGNSEELHINHLASKRESQMDEKSNKNCVDIFGYQLTSKDRNKMKVNCPHCAKKVPAPGFVRHLSYCMRVRIRKSGRRS